MAVTGEWLAGHGKRHMYLAHPEVSDKPAYLALVGGEIAQAMGTPVPARMLKTVTIRFGSGETTLRVLVGTVGRPVDNTVKKGIAADFGLSGKVAKSAAINAQDGWDPAVELKLAPGVVGPLLEDVSASVSAYYFLAETFDADAPPVPVELALSPRESLVVLYQDLAEALPRAQAAFVGDPEFFRSIPPPESALQRPVTELGL